MESQICWIPSVSLTQKFTMNRLEEEKKKQSLGGVLWKGVLTNFAKFTGKHLCQSLFPVNFYEISIIPFIIQHLWWLLLNFWNSFQLCYKRTPVQVFSYEFCKTSENNFSVKQSKTISSDLYCSTPCLSSSFVYYSWKSLFLQNILEGLRDNPVLQNTDLWYNNTIPPFWEGNLSIC